MIPKDPIMLLSFVNTKLRDFYPNLEALCEDLDVSQKEMEETLEKVGFEYNKELNKFQ